VAAYSLGFIGAQPGSGVAGPVFAIRTGAADIRILEIWGSCDQSAGAAGDSLLLYRTSALGTASTSVLGQAQDPNDAASLTNIDTAWSANPTKTGVAFRSRYYSANAGDQVVWHWSEDSALDLGASSSIVGWRDTTTAAAFPRIEFFVLWEE